MGPQVTDHPAAAMEVDDKWLVTAVLPDIHAQGERNRIGGDLQNATGHVALPVPLGPYAQKTIAPTNQKRLNSI